MVDQCCLRGQFPITTCDFPRAVLLIGHLGPCCNAHGSRAGIESIEIFEMATEYGNGAIDLSIIGCTSFGLQTCY